MIFVFLDINRYYQLSKNVWRNRCPTCNQIIIIYISDILLLITKIGLIGILMNKFKNMKNEQDVVVFNG